MNNHFLAMLLILCTFRDVFANDEDSSTFHTSVVTTQDSYPTGKINYKIVDKPHHLFIGRCTQEDVLVHQENLIVKNDGKSQVSGIIRMNVDGPVRIACVKIFDEVPNGEGAYPGFVSGGLNHNFVEFNVITPYGKGFHFFVQIFAFKNTNTSATSISPMSTTTSYF